MVLETKIIAHNDVAKGIHEVTLKRPDCFEFKAGQYTQIKVPKLIKSDSKGRSRQFSLASSPYDRDNLKIVFRVSGSGFKETLMAMEIDSSLTIEQASGSFLLPQKLSRPHIFVAGGVGVAPFMSYLNQKILDSWEYPITLIYGNQSPESAAYLPELKLMEKKQKNFLLSDLYKRPTPDMFTKISKKYPDSVWWVVGPPGMVSATVQGLQDGGVLNKNIITESFDGY